MLEKLINQLQELEKTTIQLKAQGEYPVKARTKVQHVAKWQNDGTERISAAHFVEDAVRMNRGWATPVFKAVSKHLDGLEWELDEVGMQIAYDINEAVNRIRTGRLKKSFRPEVIKK